MFTNEIKVSGAFIRGMVKRSEKAECRRGEKPPYVLITGSLGVPSQEHTAADLRMIATELQKIADRIDDENGVHPAEAKPTVRL